MNIAEISLLNPQQQAAVTASPNLPWIILASAGSGKTTVVIARIKHYVDTGVDPQKILVLVFTRKAAREVRDRLVLYGIKLNPEQVLTFHSLGMRQLAHHYYLMGFTKCPKTIRDDSERKKLVAQCIRTLEVNKLVGDACTWLNVPQQGATWDTIVDTLHREHPAVYERCWREAFAPFQASIETSQALPQTAGSVVEQAGSFDGQHAKRARACSTAGNGVEMPRNGEFSIIGQNQSPPDVLTPTGMIDASIAAANHATPPTEHSVPAPVGATAVASRSWAHAAVADILSVHHNGGLAHSEAPVDVEDSNNPLPPLLGTPPSEMDFDSRMNFLKSIYLGIIEAQDMHWLIPTANQKFIDPSELNPKKRKEWDEKVTDHFKFIKNAKTLGATPGQYVGTWQAVYEMYEATLRDLQSIDYDDMNIYLYRLLQYPHIRARLQDKYQYLLVDEYQDLNALQFRVVTDLAGEEARITAVGDTAQSIYGFRGSQPWVMDAFQAKYSTMNPNLVLSLTDNYRSTQNILKVSEIVLGRHQSKELRAARGVAGAAVTIWETGTDVDEAEGICRMIKKHAAEGVPYGQMCILLRILKTRGAAVHAAFKAALDSHNIPNKLLKEQTLHKREVVRDIKAYVTLAVDPHDDASFLEVVNKPRRGFGDAAVVALKRFQSQVPQRRSLYECVDLICATDRLKPLQKAGLRAFMATIDDLRGAVLSRDPVEFLYYAMISSGYVDWKEIVSSRRNPVKDDPDAMYEINKGFRPRGIAGFDDDEDGQGTAIEGTLEFFDTSSSEGEEREEGEEGGNYPRWWESDEDEDGEINVRDGPSTLDESFLDDNDDDDEWPELAAVHAAPSIQQQQQQQQQLGGGHYRAAENRSGRGSFLEEDEEAEEESDEEEVYDVDPLTPYCLDLSPFKIATGPLRRLLREAALFCAEYKFLDNNAETEYLEQGMGPPSLMRIAWIAASRGSSEKSSLGRGSQGEQGQRGRRRRRRQREEERTEEELRRSVVIDRQRAYLWENKELQSWAARLKLGPVILQDFIIRTFMEKLDEGEGILDRNNVVISTIHGAKGLEWDVVFLPRFNSDFLPSFYKENNLGPAPAPPTEPLIPGYDPPPRDDLYHDHLDEEMRLAHVACTRARHHLRISIPRYSKTYLRHKLENPSPLIGDIMARLRRRIMFNGVVRGARQDQEQDHVVVVEVIRDSVTAREREVVRTNDIWYNQNAMHPHPMWLTHLGVI